MWKKYNLPPLYFRCTRSWAAVVLAHVACIGQYASVAKQSSSLEYAIFEFRVKRSRRIITSDILIDISVLIDECM